jgi:uncharacterized repeat protein (TIGR01451 family)
MSERRPRRVWLAALPLLALMMLFPALAGAAVADLSVDKSDSPDPVRVGDELAYTINVFNAGPGAASGVVLTDTLPSHVDFVSASSSQGGCELKGNKVTCNLGTVAAGSPSSTPAATVTIRVRPTKDGQISNAATVEVGAGDTDPSSANNSDTETTTVLPRGGGGGGGGGGGAACSGQAATIVGTGGADTLTGTAGRDVIVARGGNDLIKGLGGKDVVCGGGGRDTAKGGAGNDRLKGGRGRDRLRGGPGSDDMFGGGGNDSCRGGPGHDTEHSC